MVNPPTNWREPMSKPRFNRRTLLQLFGASTFVGATPVTSTTEAAVSANKKTTSTEDQIRSLFEIDTGRTPETITSTDNGTVVYGGNERLVALDGETGDEIWTKRIRLPDDNPGLDLKSNYVVSAAGPVVVVYSTSLVVETITAYSVEDGKERWQASFDGRLRAVEVDGLGVFVADESNTVTAIDAETGETKWQTSELLDLPGFSTRMKLVGSVVVVNSEDPQSLVAYEREEGELAWQETFDTELSIAFRVAGDPSTVYAVPNESFAPDTESVTLKRIDAETGEKQWTEEFNSLIEAESYGHFRVVADTVLLMTEAEGDSVVKLVAVDADSSERRWELTVKDDRARLTATADNALVLSLDFDRDPNSALDVIDLQTGEITETIEAPDRSGSGGGDPLIEHNGFVYHERDAEPGTRIWAIDLQEGELAQDIEVMGRLNAPILQEFASVNTQREFLDGALLIPARDETLTAVEPDGSVRWIHETGGYVLDAARSDDDNLTVIYTEGGSVLGVNEASGGIEWSTRQTGVSNAGFGDVASGVIIADGEAYVDTSVPRADNTGRLGAYDLGTGEQLWETPIDSVPVAKYVKKNKFFAGIDGITDTKLITIDRETGELDWEVDLEETAGSGLEHVYDSADPFEILGQRSDSIVFIEIDPNEQSVTRTVEIEAVDPFIDATVKTADTLVIAGSNANDSGDLLLGFDVTTGEILWKQRFETNEILSVSEGLADGVVAYLFEETFEPPELRLIDTESGDIVGSRQLERIEDTPLLTTGETNFYVQDGATIVAIPPDIEEDDEEDRPGFDISPPLVTMNADNDNLHITQAFEPFQSAVDDGATENTTLTLDNVGSSSWELTEITGDGVTAPTGEENPTIKLQKGRRYRVKNNGWDAHPLALRDDDGTELLTQDGSGTFEAEDNVEWVDEDDAIEFTLTESLAEELSTYVCTIHSSMEGTIGTDSREPEKEEPSVEDYADEDGEYPRESVFNAIADWRNNTIDRELAFDVISEWRTGN